MLDTLENQHRDILRQTDRQNREGTLPSSALKTGTQLDKRREGTFSVSYRHNVRDNEMNQRQRRITPAILH